MSVAVLLEFHTGMSDKLDYACRLLRKAYRQGVRVLVCGEPDRLARLDTRLWTFEQLEFVPHARLRAGERPASALQRTPIWLADGAAQFPAGWPLAEVAVNLGDAVIDEPQRYARVIELVGTDDTDRDAGRQRWRQYAAAGLQPVQAQARGTAAAASEDATSNR